MVAAYLVGTRGKPRHAVALGATVTVAHTVGVFLLGFVTLALSQYVLPEDLYPWLNLVSGLLVVVIGAGVLRSRMRWTRARRVAASEGVELPDAIGPSADGGHSHGHAHGHGHTHQHGHAHSHDRRPATAAFCKAASSTSWTTCAAAHHAHGHAHGHAATARLRTPTPSRIPSQSAASSASARRQGLIPCPSALVVLLGAIAQHEVALGLLLITAFSLGLAGTLTGLGLAVVYARKLVPRLAPRLALPSSGGMRRVVAAMPAASALVIVAVGCLLTAKALPGVV